LNGFSLGIDSNSEQTSAYYLDVFLTELLASVSFIQYVKCCFLSIINFHIFVLLHEGNMMQFVFAV